MDDILNPVTQRAFAAREEMFQVALRASMDWATGQMEALRGENTRLKERLAICEQQLRNTQAAAH